MDKLKNIKEEWTAAGDISGGDVNWLIAEVERLRETVAIMSDPETMNAIVEGQNG
jgi:hypothetical protein